MRLLWQTISKNSCTLKETFDFDLLTVFDIAPVYMQHDFVCFVNDLKSRQLFEFSFMQALNTMIRQDKHQFHFHFEKLDLYLMFNQVLWDMPLKVAWSTGYSLYYHWIISSQFHARLVGNESSSFNKTPCHVEPAI